MRRLLFVGAGLDAVLLAWCLNTDDLLGCIVAIVSGVLCLYAAEVRPRA